MWPLPDELQTDTPQKAKYFRVSALLILNMDSGQSVIATHPRSIDRSQQVERPEHITTLVVHNNQAGAHRGTDYLIEAIPRSLELLTLANERGEGWG